VKVSEALAPPQRLGPFVLAAGPFLEVFFSAPLLEGARVALTTRSLSRGLGRCGLSGCTVDCGDWSGRTLSTRTLVGCVMASAAGASPTIPSVTCVAAGGALFTSSTLGVASLLLACATLCLLVLDLFDLVGRHHARRQ
jgi:hypothetical protein